MREKEGRLRKTWWSQQRVGQRRMDDVNDGVEGPAVADEKGEEE